jgi:hypothetical protein
VGHQEGVGIVAILDIQNLPVIALEVARGAALSSEDSNLKKAEVLIELLLGGSDDEQQLAYRTLALPNVPDAAHRAWLLATVEERTLLQAWVIAEANALERRVDAWVREHPAEARAWQEHAEKEAAETWGDLPGAYSMTSWSDAVTRAEERGRARRTLSFALPIGIISGLAIGYFLGAKRRKSNGEEGR